MGYVNVTNRFNNQDKRYSESVVMTCPAQLDEGGQRVSTPPTYIKSGDAWTSATVSPGTIIKRVYLIIDEAFPAGTTLSVDIAGTAYFTDVDGAATGITVSTTEDVYLKLGQTITTGVINGTTGSEIASGVCRVVLDVVSPNLKNGQYAAS